MAIKTKKKCYKDTEVYSRVVGFYRPIRQWNKGKAREFVDRKPFNIDSSKLTMTYPEMCEQSFKKTSANE